MRVLVACEFSGIVRDAFIERGHDAMSCDLLPTERPGPHYQGDVLDIINDGWDMMIAHPPCTYLTNSAEWAYKDGPYHQTVKPETLVGQARREAREKALEFVRDLLNAPIKRKCIENPVGQISSRIFWYIGGEDGPARWEVFPRRLTTGGIQPHIIQPWMFGEDASKATCLYTVNLPKLKPTEIIAPRIVNGKKRWSNQTDGGQNILAPSSDRWKIRSENLSRHRPRNGPTMGVKRHLDLFRLN